MWDSFVQLVAAALLVVAGAIIGWALFSDRSHGRKRCPKCWYDMAQAEGLRCPECGRSAASEARLFRTRRRWRRSLLAVLPMLAGAYFIVLPQAKREGWVTFVPTTALFAFDLKTTTWAFDEIVRRASTSVAFGPTQRQQLSEDLLHDWQWRRLGEALIARMETETSPTVLRDHVGRMAQIRTFRQNDPLAFAIETELNALLRDPVDDVRRYAFMLLADKAKLDETLTRAGEFLDDPSEEIRIEAIRMFRELEPTSDRTLASAKHALADSYHWVRTLGLAIIKDAAAQRAIPADVIEAVRAMDSDPNSGVRELQIDTVIALVDDEEALAIIRKTLNEGDAEMRKAAQRRLLDRERGLSRLYVLDVLAWMKSEKLPTRKSGVAWLNVIPAEFVQPHMNEVLAAIEKESDPANKAALQHIANRVRDEMEALGGASEDESAPSGERAVISPAPLE